MSTGDYDNLGMSDDDYHREKAAIVYQDEALMRIREAIELLEMAATNSQMYGPQLRSFAHELGNCSHDNDVSRLDWTSELAAARVRPK